MKKIISVCSLIIVAAILVTVFTACGTDKGDGTTTTTAPSTTGVQKVEIGELTLTVNESNAVVLNNGQTFQTLSYPQGKGTPFALEYAKDHYDFVDINFDGNLDLYIAVAEEDGVIYYYCWLYNATTCVFDYSVSLSALTNISIDSAEQLIYAVGISNDGKKVISSYTWVNGVLTFIESYGAEEDIPEDIQQSANNNTIGNKPNSEKPVTDNSTTAPAGNAGTADTTKPLLTTEPNTGSGIVLVDPTDEVWY